jgi:branched-chain amino acid transport system ATP-binding protein
MTAPTIHPPPTLSTRGLSRRWGGFHANSDISLSFAPGARHALIGPNGAGKTTFINLLTGTLAPTAGQVLLDDEDITRLPAHQRVKRGITRTFQINTLFPVLTVLESVMLAIFERTGASWHWHRTVASHKDARDEAMALLCRLQLGADALAPTHALPYGKQRLVEIALALATHPRILLLDEPAAGIPSRESTELFDITILFIEHDMNLVFRFAERITVLLAGRVLTEGTPQEIAADPRVREVYLGEVEHA